VAKWVSFLQVSRSGYYSYLSGRKVRESKENALKKRVKDLFDESGGCYGPTRVVGVLRRLGEKASYHKISRLMAEMGLCSIHNRYRSRSLTNSKKSRGLNLPNLVRGQSFNAPYQAVCSDITYIRTGEGWLYLCVVKDIVTGEILGLATSDNMRKELVIKAFLNAHARHNLPIGIIHHSDRGSQYTSKEFIEMLAQLGVKQSFSRIGMPGDNTWAESFFATFKKERVHFNHFATRDEAAFATFAWIEGRYNNKRAQERLGFISPTEFRKSLLNKGLKSVA